MKSTWPLLAVIVLAVGCGSGSGGAGGGSGGAAGGGSGGGSGGGTGGSGGGTTAGGNRGTANITQQDQFTSYFRGASASFYPMGLPADVIDPACAITTSGPCKVRDCQYDGGNAPRGDAGILVSAGAMLAEVGSAGTITLNRGANGGYLGFQTATNVWWDGGETVTLTATGGDGGVPAFTSMLAAPTRIAVTSPEIDGGGAIIYTRAAGLTVGWGGGVGATQVVLSSVATNTARFVQAVCEVQASAGTFTIPGAVTQVFPIGSGSVYLQNTTRTTTAAGSWSIEVSASSVSAARNTTAQ
jgi:hypothetical protein